MLIIHFRAHIVMKLKPSNREVHVCLAEILRLEPLSGYPSLKCAIKHIRFQLRVPQKHPSCISIPLTATTMHFLANLGDLKSGASPRDFCQANMTSLLLASTLQLQCVLK